MTPVPVDEWHLPNQRLGRRVLVYDSLPSTNALAATLAEPSNDGLVLLAHEQTAGRGQYARTWTCPRDSGVLLSIILDPPPVLRRPVVMAALAAVAVCETVAELVSVQPERLTDLQGPHTELRIKWPNDVLFAGRKICGILAEQSQATILGIGLNLSQTTADFEAMGLPQAGSLQSLTGGTYDWADAARCLVTQVDRLFGQMLEEGGRELEARWRHYLRLHGREVTVETHSAFVDGRLIETTFASLILATPDGTQTFTPELVRHLDLRVSSR